MYMKAATNIKDVDFEVKWTGKPDGLWQGFLTTIGLNFTEYQITDDELIIKGYNRAKKILDINNKLYVDVFFLLVVVPTMTWKVLIG